LCYINIEVLIPSKTQQLSSVNDKRYWLTTRRHVSAVRQPSSGQRRT